MGSNYSTSEHYDEYSQIVRLSCECSKCESGLFDDNGKRILPKGHDMLKYQLNLLIYSGSVDRTFPYSCIEIHKDDYNGYLVRSWNQRCLICFKELTYRERYLENFNEIKMIYIERCQKCAETDSHICENSFLPIIKYSESSKYGCDLIPYNQCQKFCVINKIMLLKLSSYIIDDILFKICLYLNELH